MLGFRELEDDSHSFHLNDTGSVSFQRCNWTFKSLTQPSHLPFSVVTCMETSPVKMRSIIFDKRICSWKHASRPGDARVAFGSFEHPSGNHGCISGKFLYMLGKDESHEELSDAYGRISVGSTDASRHES